MIFLLCVWWINVCISDIWTDYTCCTGTKRRCALVCLNFKVEISRCAWVQRHQQMALCGHLSAQHIKRVSVSLNQGASEPSPSAQPGFPSSQTDNEASGTPGERGLDLVSNKTRLVQGPRWLGSDPPAVEEGWISEFSLRETRSSFHI